MSLICDTNVWSLLLRRRGGPRSSDQERALLILTRHLDLRAAYLIGPVAQELLTGIRTPTQYDELAAALSEIPTLQMEMEDYCQAARFHNECFQRGVAASPPDMLVAAVAARHEMPILTLDGDFHRYSEFLPIRLYL
ncbi:MAG: PIN domain-containing protein [Bryobacter sp.]|nr:PIN domain-containing protein [Bryobacter sp.]